MLPTHTQKEVHLGSHLKASQLAVNGMSAHKVGMWLPESVFPG